MAGSITSDLTVISLADSTTGWSGTSGALDTEVYKQAATIGSDGAYAYQTGKNTLASCTFTPATNINMTANYTTPHIYFTMRCDVFPFCEALNTGATNSGLMLRVTDGAGNYTQWHLEGSDTWDGSWRNFVLDLTNTANIHTTSGTLSLSDVDIITWYTDNSNSGTIRIIDNTWLDSVRYGDGLQAESATTEAFDFTDIALDDILTANYYGVIQDTEGVLFCQGGVILGDAVGSATCNFVSSGETVYFKDQLVSSSHYLLTAVASATATTDIDITSLVCKTVGGTGAEVTISDADLNSVSIVSSSFIDMGAITLTYASGVYKTTGFSGCGIILLASGVTFTGCSVDNCGQLTHAGATLNDTIVTGYGGTANTSAMLYDVAVDPDGEMDAMQFTMGTTLTHAIEFGTNVPSTMTIRDIDFVGYNASNNVNDSTFHFKDTAGTITLNIVGGSGNVSYRTDGATIVIVQDPVTTSVHAQTVDQADVGSARVLLKASDGTGPLPFEDVVVIAQTGGTATVTHTAHGFATNHYVVIKGAIPEGYNKVAQVTVLTSSTYTYAVDSGLSSPATGTPVATGAIVYGLTDVNGDISDSRTLATDQPVVGWCRKSTSSPFYKSAPLGGVVSSSLGASFTAIMISDE
ncbi:hypothetical protein GQ473_00620 [archaeon]|nr:hypothetical protein [archaeon]